MRRIKIKLLTAADGTATAFSDRVSGKVHAIHYQKDGASAFADGVDFVVTAEATGESVWAENNVNAAAARYPRAATHTQAGAPALYAAGGTPVQDKIGLVLDRLKVVVAQGGNAKKGALIVLLDD